jgi:hypothetical protein
MAPASGVGLICLAWEEAGVHRVRRPAGACHPFNQRKEMALTIVKTPITGGVDAHADVHVAAALDPVGGLLGVAEFPVTPAGYARLLSLPPILEIPQTRSLKFPSWLSVQRVVAEVSGCRA